MQHLLAEDATPERSHTLVMEYRRPGSKHLTYRIPTSEWPNVVQLIVEQKESLRTVATAYGVSYETIRRIMFYIQNQRGQQKA